MMFAPWVCTEGILLELLTCMHGFNLHYILYNLFAPLYRHTIFYFWLKLAPTLLFAKTSTGATFVKN